MIKRTLVLIALLGIIVFVFGCACNKAVTIKNSLQKAPTGKCPWEQCGEIKADWNRIAGMTDEQICKVLKCPPKVEIKEVIKEVPGPERIVEKEVIKEVPVEKVVVKEVPVEKVVEKPLFVLPDEFFDFDKAIIRPGGEVELTKAAKTLSDMGYPAINISGHTDAIGSEEYNMKLSDRRAEAVKKFLEGKGVPADKMMAKGFGKTKPIATNKTAEGRQQNRRVEIRLANP